MPSRLTEIPDAPDAVVRFHRAFAAVSRAVILHELLAGGPAQRVDLAAKLGVTGPSVRRALDELVEAGYVSFRLPATSEATTQEQPHGTRYAARRDRVMSDLAATMAWLSESRT